ncbi:hypothetical protein ACWD4G_28920 [Streptomyces sp. NPDC002643]
MTGNHRYTTGPTPAHRANADHGPPLGDGREYREERIRAFARGERPSGIPEAAVVILTRDAPLAEAMTDFLRRLADGSRDAPYPAERLRVLEHQRRRRPHPPA